MSRGRIPHVVLVIALTVTLLVTANYFKVAYAAVRPGEWLGPSATQAVEAMHDAKTEVAHIDAGRIPEAENEQPMVTEVCPNEGNEVGKSWVRIIGQNLTGVTEVWFGPVVANQLASKSDHLIELESPPYDGRLFPGKAVPPVVKVIVSGDLGTSVKGGKWDDFTWTEKHEGAGAGPGLVTDFLQWLHLLPCE